MASQELATLGGGCFWCIEAAFNMLKGVTQVESGYAGGQLPNPDYQAICRGDSGHAEVIRVQFDPERIDYKQLLEVFFQLHDPTQLNRQGNDVGTQYRSVIFYHNEEQRNIAQTIMKEIDQAEIWPAPLVTELSPCPEFYPAEGYHQNYVTQNPNQPYCALIVNPKLSKFKHQFADLLEPEK